ncbi:hypothetical protein GBAR_LOCUS4530 [Geodia barretti]|uniref:Uncharacterized protein n=1 Tax=Geodia barretti TaxID=519541 RepID=A0AA35R7V4_GEOBA|nr:hypothetical protein GBAR_LOCUS4530 [Geodia barretti]
MDGGWQSYFTLTGQNATANSTVSYSMATPVNSPLLPEEEIVTESSHEAVVNR